MKKLNVSLVIFLATLFLAGCGPICYDSYTYQPPHSSSGKMCVAHCSQAKNRCEQSCQIHDQNCRIHARQDSFAQYQAYKAQQVAQGKPVQKTINDFDNEYDSCNHPCNCGSDFNACYQTCGGTVITSKVC